jgi:hypothetical protein
MALSTRLLHVDLTLECRHCGHSITKTGKWFRVAHRFTCVRCKREVPIGYSDKVALFKKHALLLETQAEVDSPLTADRNTFAPSLIRH